MLSREKPQALTTRCFKVNKGHVVVSKLDVFDPGHDALLGYFAAALRLGCLQDNIADRRVTAHQYLVVGMPLVGDVVMMPDFSDFTGDHRGQALATITIAATIAQCQARTQAGFKQSGVTPGNKLTFTGKNTDSVRHRME